MLLATSLVLACSGSGPQPITAEDLEAMVITKDELGPKFAGLNRIVSTSGPTSDGALYDDSPVTGYPQNFTGAVRISINLEAYQNADGPREAVATMREVMLGEGVMGPVEEFNIPAIGDEARGIRMGTEPPGGITQIVLCRRDRVFFVLAIESAEGSPLAGNGFGQDVIELAEKQAEKIETELAE